MAVKVCVHCGEDNSENAISCVQCSSSLANAKTEGTLNSEKVKSTKERFCNNCNEKLNENDTKCKYWGTVYTKEIKSNKSYMDHHYSSNSNSAGILLYIVTFFIPIVGMIVGGVFAFNDDSEKQSLGKGLLVFGLVMTLLTVIVSALLVF